MWTFQSEREREKKNVFDPTTSKAILLNGCPAEHKGPYLCPFLVSSPNLTPNRRVKSLSSSMCVGEFGSRQEHCRREHLDVEAAPTAPSADRARGDQKEGGAR